MLKILSQLKQLFFRANQRIHPQLRCPPSTPSHHRWCNGGLSLGLLFPIPFILFIMNCGLDVEDPSPPPPPQWVQKSLPDEWAERGIDANEFRGIFLEWEPNLKEEVGAYFIYRAQYYELNDSIGTFIMLAHLITESYSKTEYVDQQAMPTVGYYYKIKAVNTSGTSSDFSESIFYCNLRSIRTDTLYPNGRGILLPSDRSLSWYYSTSIDMENYCVTVMTEKDSLIVRELFQPHNYVGSLESWQFPDHILLEANKIYKWRIDIGGNYIEGRETSGAESSWARFLYWE